MYCFFCKDKDGMGLLKESDERIMAFLIESNKKQQSLIEIAVLK
jgi:hypothetical protein